MSWTTTTIRPLGPRVLVRMDPPEVKLGGLIVVPDTCVRQAGAGIGRQAHSLGDRYGTCVAVGTGHWEQGRKQMVHQPVPIEVGERVLFGMYNGVQIPPPEDDPEGEYWIMTTMPRGNDINPEVWGVIEGKGEAAQ